MVRKIEDAIDFTEKLEKECDPNFVAAIPWRCVNVLANSFCVRQKNIDFLKDQNFHFYVTSDLEAPIKVAIRRLPIRTPDDKIHSVLIYEGLDIIKTVQMISRKDGRKLPLFLLDL